MLQIGPYKIANRVLLAPMAGVSDLPFRRLCMEMGAGMAVSEMISSNPRLRDSRKTQLRARHDQEKGLRAVQIAGNDPIEMADAARYNVDRSAQIIDINMGCPAKKVCRKAAGSALLADESLVAEILSAVVAAVEVPVTLKIRTGSSPEQRNGVAIARIAQDSGISALTVHGRTRACAFKGQAEYDTIAEIVAAVSIPVIANGDIDSPQSAAAVLKHTSADAVMIGRAAQGQPWLCGEIARYLASSPALEPLNLRQKLAVAHQHIESLHQFYGEVLGVRIARKHFAWYMQYITTDTNARKMFNGLQTAAEQLCAIDHYQKNHQHITEQEVLAA